MAQEQARTELSAKSIKGRFVGRPLLNALELVMENGCCRKEWVPSTGAASSRVLQVSRELTKLSSSAYLSLRTGDIISLSDNLDKPAILPPMSMQLHSDAGHHDFEGGF